MNTKLFIYHLHSDYSSCTTNIDSATKVKMYVDKAKEYGMTALAFSEHGNIYNWFEKKDLIEKAGMKYVHGIECYITESLEEKIRDNYHCVLLAKNIEGFKEINKLVSISYNRKDGHFYYVPRITMDEFEKISNNIIVCSACLGSILHKGSISLKTRYINYFIKNRDRCYLEIQHHNTQKQKEYNLFLYEISKKYNLKIVCGTDTHSLNNILAEARVILQKARKTFFPEEEGWDMTFKNREELTQSYIKQNCLPMNVVNEAMDNTLEIENSIEAIELDFSKKYPKLWEDPIGEFRKQVYDSIESHPYALKNHTKEELINRVEEEIKVYEKTETIDFMLFQKMVRDYEHQNNVYVGPGRGSVSGSMIAYLLGVTEMDSIKFDLHFFRFLNPDRVSNADIDSDYFDKDRDITEKFLFENKKLNCAKVVAFNTVALKGAILDVGRALGMSVPEAREVSNSILIDENKNMYADEKLRKKYAELFKWVDLLNGVIVSVGTHAAGVLCSTLEIDKEIGLTSLSTVDYPVSSLDMYGLDALWYTKLDLLGLDNVGFINETCKLAGIEKINPDNLNLNDWEVWKSIREDTSMIFQYESDFASLFIKDLFSDNTISKIKEYNPNMSYLRLFSFGNALLRPCGASVRNDCSKGNIILYGIKDIDDMLAPELGRCCVQESFMMFVMKFCGYSLLEADILRKKIAKKKGTADAIEEIKERFKKVSMPKYNINDEKANEIIEPICQCILDASRYAFSWNHADAYSFIGYACGWLRYYYPLEFCTVCFNVWQDKTEKTALVLEYATKHGIKLKEPRFRYSKSEYFFDKESNTIYKGMKSIKNISKQCSDKLYDLKNNKYECFSELLFDISKNKALESDQLDILIKLDFFEEFGNCRELLKIVDIFKLFKKGEAKSIKRENILDVNLKIIIEKYSTYYGVNGNELKSYNIFDCQSIIKEAEQVIKSHKCEDLPVKLKIEAQKEFLGYVATTNKAEDGPMLHVQDIFELKRKKDQKQFGYSIIAKSVGSGKITRYTIFNSTFKKCGKIKKDSIIFCLKYNKSIKENVVYFDIEDYSVVC